MGDDLKFKLPYICLLSCPSGSGKVSFCICFLHNLKEHRTVPVFNGGIVWCIREISTMPYQQLVGKKLVCFHEGVPADFNNSVKNRAS